MQRSGMATPRRAAIARGLLVLAAVLLLPLAAILQTPRPSAAQSRTYDSLWAGPSYQDAGNILACANPSSPESMSSCFSTATQIGKGWSWVAMAADNLNVYFVSDDAGAVSCPISDLGENCTAILWNWTNARSVAAADGQLWIGFDSGKIYRCPATIPWSVETGVPSQCVLLNDAGDRSVRSLLIANGRLYAGLGIYKNQGILWSCDPFATNACSNLDAYGDTWAGSLSAGGGYLWAGLASGVLWRCDPVKANACDNWWKTDSRLQSVSYGQGTVYAAAGEGTCAGNHNTNCPGSVLACPATSSNACITLLPEIDGGSPFSVAAGAGGAFSSNAPGRYFFNTVAFTNTWGNDGHNLRAMAYLLYVPAGGPVGVGGVSLTVKSAAALSKNLTKRCKDGKNPKATVTVTGPNDVAKTMKVGMCDLVKGGILKTTVDLLDPGAYTVTVQARKHSGQASFTIEQDTTKPVNVTLTRGSKGG